MTTWDEETTKLDFHSWLFQKTPNDSVLIERILRVKPLQLDKDDQIGLKRHTKLNSYEGVKHLFPRLAMRKDERMSTQLLALMERADVVLTGISAIYKMFSFSWDEKVNYSKEIDFKGLFEAQDHYMDYDSLLSVNTPKRIQALKETCELPQGFKHYYTRYMSLSSMFSHMGYYHRTRTHRDRVGKSERFGEAWPETPEFKLGPNWSTLLFESTVATEYTDPTNGKKLLMVFETKALRRLIMLLRSVAKMAVYYTNTYLTSHDRTVFDAWRKYMDLMSEAMGTTKRPNELARALDICLFSYIALTNDDITDRAVVLQKDKYLKGNYEDIIGRMDVVRIGLSLGFMDAIDVLKTYKILPCPDFDPSTGFLNNTEFLKNQNSFGVLPNHISVPNLQISVDDFRIYQKMQMVRRYYSVHRECPGRLTPDGVAFVLATPSSHLSSYPHVSPSSLSLGDMQYIEIRQSGTWDAWNNNDPQHYNDKSSPPQFISMSKIPSSYEFNELGIENRSMLGFYLSQPSVPHGDALRWSYFRGVFPNEQRAYFKPENKKPDPRNFFSATPYQRLIRAEFESNVATYLDNDNSSVTGKSPHDSVKLMQDLLSRTSHNCKRVYLSFDLEKFSPQMPQEASDLANDIWIELFDQPYMSEVKNIFRNPQCHYFHEGIHQTYTPKFADFEGQLGKVNTAFHIDLMAYAVRQLKLLNLIEGAGSLLVLIDDGLLGINVSKDNMQIAQIMDVLESVYWFFGLRISWDKTFVSSRFAMFLNEIWRDSVRYTGGIKAFLKMQPQKVADEFSLSGKVKGLIAMAQGAVKAGLDPHISSAELFREVYLLLKSYLRKQMRDSCASPRMMSMFMLMPVGLGGIGLPTAISLMGTVGSTPIDVFIDQIMYICACFPQHKNAYFALTQQPIRSRSTASIVRAPMAIRRSGSTLTEWKHVEFLMDYVKSHAESKYARIIFNINVETEASTILTGMPLNSTIDEISNAYRSSLLGLLDKFVGKFKRSSTLIGMIRPRAKVALLGRYAGEVRKVFLQSMSVLSHLK